MYEIIKNVIVSGNYELTSMLTKIETVWIQGDLIDEQRLELIELARKKALPENSFASIQNQVATLFKNQLEMAQALKEVIDRVNVLEGRESAPEEETDEYPEYAQPTGAHDAYYAGVKVTYNGLKYICIAPEGVAVVWNPDVMPSYWQLVEETE